MKIMIDYYFIRFVLNLDAVCAMPRKSRKVICTICRESCLCSTCMLFAQYDVNIVYAAHVCYLQ